jgi:hypothetical protein
MMAHLGVLQALRGPSVASIALLVVIHIRTGPLQNVQQVLTLGGGRDRREGGEGGGGRGVREGRRVKRGGG